VVQTGTHSNKQINAVATLIVRLKTADFLRLGLYAALRGGKLKWAMLVVAVIIFAMNVHHTRTPWMPSALIATFLTTAIFVFGYFLLVVALTVLSAVLRNRRGTPAREVQTYSLTDLGLSRKSDSSETLLKWGGALALHRNKNAIYVATSSLTYLILPRRSFATDEEYGSVWNELQKLARPKGSGGS
jgi:hypothetical protein